jgi:hypothetical protein
VKRKRGIPFIGLMDDIRNAQLAADDPKTPPELRAELKRYLANPFHAAAADQYQLLAEADARANPGKGRKPGARNKAAGRIDAIFNRLYRANPDCSSEEIRKFKGPKLVKSMGQSTVARHWKAAKKRAGK